MHAEKSIGTPARTPGDKSLFSMVEKNTRINSTQDSNRNNESMSR